MVRYLYPDEPGLYGGSVVDMKVLLVEDDVRLSRFVERGLSEEGHTVIVRDNGNDAEDQICLEEYDVVILDLMLPGQSGFEVLRHIRAAGVGTPVIILTARDRLEDKIKGLEAGADDYLTKPFAFDELLARLRAVHRRSVSLVRGTLTCGPLSLDSTSHQIRCNGIDLALTHTEYALMAYLLHNPNRILSRTQLEEHVWGDDYDRATNVVAVYISYLRNKLAAHGYRDLIQTVRGFGYRLRCDG